MKYNHIIQLFKSIIRSKCVSRQTFDEENILLIRLQRTGRRIVDNIPLVLCLNLLNYIFDPASFPI